MMLVSKRFKKNFVVVLIILISVWFWWAHKHHSASTMGQESINVEAIQVKSGSINQTAEAIGTLTAAAQVKITPEFAGHVAKIFFQDGSFVKQGAPLIQLDDTVAKAKMESDKAHLVYSENNYKRMQFLGKRGAISQQAIDQALAEFTEKKAQAQESQVSFEKMLLTAPFDGSVGQSKVHLGDYVTVGEELVTLTDTHHLRVEYSVPEKYLSSLKLGQIVKLTTNAYPGKEFTGKVTFISPTINTDNRTISLYADIGNEEGLLTAGLFVNVVQSLGMENNALLVPAASLMATIDGQQVFKVVNKKAISVPVTIGQRTADNVQVVKGLSSGDCIVVAGQNKLKEGDGVLIKKVG